MQSRNFGIVANLGYDKGAITLRQVIENNSSHKCWIDICSFENCEDVGEQNYLLRFKFEQLSLAISDFVEARANELLKRSKFYEGNTIYGDWHEKELELHKYYLNMNRDARKTT